MGVTDAQSDSIVVLGGTGNFGARICRRLTHHENIQLTVTSRKRSTATAFADHLRQAHPGCRVRGVALDLDSAGWEVELAACKPDIVVHTAGPFQGQDYRVARACIDVGSHYIDLADGREFVAGFSALDAMARANGVLAVSGASTLPGLSSAVVSHIAAQLPDIAAIRTVIAPAHQTPRGRSTITAVLSYCGKPFRVRQDGQWRQVFGWQDLQPYVHPRLASRRAAACDVPDLQLFPALYPGLQTATFHAAPEAWWEQRSLWIMAALARVGLVRDWSSMAGLFARVGRVLMPFGSDRGGMTVYLEGKDQSGRHAVIHWELLAGSNHGPEIPCTPALVLVRLLREGRLAMRGAIPCLSLFTLDDFDRELAGFDISWRLRHAPAGI